MPVVNPKFFPVRMGKQSSTKAGQYINSNLMAPTMPATAASTRNKNKLILIADKRDSSLKTVTPPRTADPGVLRFAYKRDTPPLIEIAECPV